VPVPLELAEAVLAGGLAGVAAAAGGGSPHVTCVSCTAP